MKNPLSIIYHHSFHIFTTSHSSKTKYFSLGECSFHLFIYYDHLIHFQHLPSSMLFYTKHRFQQIVATTSICFLALHEGMLILQFGGGIATHDGCFLLSFSFKAYNFIFIQCNNWFAYIFKTMNWILVISR